MDNYLLQYLTKQNYNELEDWHLPDLNKFSKNKILYDYQEEALKNITKLLHCYYSIPESSQGYNRKSVLHSHCLNEGMKPDLFDISQKEQKKFQFLQKYYPVQNDKISGYHFFNRACFWMATGSGKSLVIIKNIELLDYLQMQKLIKEKDMLLLLPREDLIIQFKAQIKDFNSVHEKKIELVSLKNYEEDKRSPNLIESIKVYYYRSDLLRNERKETILDFESYDNNGNWYIFLDEAHRGEKNNSKKETSKAQNYISVLSRNGFLFNFSATFTENLDFTTTCYNFNLEKFIAQGYGKNIYLSNSYFDFVRNHEEFSQREKQRQVLKSLLNFTLIRKSKIPEGFTYHTPLLVTLVNTVSTEDSDLLLFFKTLETIAAGKLAPNIFEEAKQELVGDFSQNKKFQFGEKELVLKIPSLEELEITDIMQQVFHSQSTGKIEMMEGKAGKELVLKLENTAKPFALIKIGDIAKFKEKLQENYTFTKPFDNRIFFDNLNNNNNIVLLIGSRSFYEGWDSNRPNVLNLINIGQKDAQKFVLQAIGRGIRIEPTKNNKRRKGLDEVSLIETLFIYATNKKAVNEILSTIKSQKTKNFEEIELQKNPNAEDFHLLIPYYKEVEKKIKQEESFFISLQSKINFKNYFSHLESNVFFLKTGKKKEEFDILTQKINNGSLFAPKEKNVYSNFKNLLTKITIHLRTKEQFVEKIDLLAEQIIHFKHIKVFKQSSVEINSLKQEITKIQNYKKENQDPKKKLDTLIASYNKKELTDKDFLKESSMLENNLCEKTYEGLELKNLANHYYLPLIYTKNKVDYIQHIIKEASEVKFIERLESTIKWAKNSNPIKNKKWMFSKIDETLDDIYIPYFDKNKNTYRKFFPDFIFWMEKENNNYQIVFVDPKGTKQSEYEFKVDGFKKKYLQENCDPKMFHYKNFKVSFALKLISDEEVGEGYQKFWLKYSNLSEIFQL